MSPRIIRSAVALFFVAIAARAAETYKIDPAHTSVGFTISHLVISEVEGRFNDVAGEVTVDDGKVTGAKAAIQAKSVDTHIDKRDNHLRSPDFFDVEKYPTLTFESTKIEKDGDRDVYRLSAHLGATNTLMSCWVSYLRKDQEDFARQFVSAVSHTD